MNPYRKASKAPEPTDEEKRLAQLAVFGMRKGPDGEWRPILERVKTDQCRNCKGFGTHGNPLCGAVYTCDRCKGTGYDPEPESLPKPKQNFWQRLSNWWNKI